MNEAKVEVTESGLKVEVAPDRKWGLAYFSNLYLPNDISSIKVSVADVSPNGKWVMKLRGNLLGDGVDRTIHLFTSTVKGNETINLDPRFPLHWKPPLELQLGLEGEPGAYAVFKSVEFLRGMRRKTPSVPIGQKSFEAIELMPDFPQPFKLIDWRSVARAYINFVFDFEKKGEFLPLIWLDETDKSQPAFGLQSYVGTKQRGNDHEAVTTLSALLTTSLMGIDKSDFLPMARAYFSEETGLVLNRKGMKNSSGDWWYDIWPSMLFLMLWDRNPKLDDGSILKSIADRWYEACLHLKGNKELPDFNHTAFDLQTLKPIDRGWVEPDAGAGIAWLEYIAWLKFGDQRYLQTVDWCLKSLERCTRNPYYEVLLPWGAYIAARTNAELGRTYDVDKLLGWCFGLCDYRWGWGTLLGNWGGYDCYGLVGSATDLGGYAYAMNTFAQAGALAPIPRYDSRYAHCIGKWLLNLANSARLFFPNELPPDKQSSYFWVKKQGGKVPIAYEGLRQNWEGKSPYGTGDALKEAWARTDLGLYGSGHMGLLSALFHPTNVAGIVMWDCLATDFYHHPAYPTYLIYNPYDMKRDVEIDLGKEGKDIYDVVSHRFLKKNVKGRVRVSISPHSAIVVVLCPSKGNLRMEGKKLLLNGIVVDYNFEK
ncbi:hypothetical protein H5T87_09885 [bacterium]|nr:hypothetical protein [bacterium]